MNVITNRLVALTREGNLRAIPRDDCPARLIDLSSNDYLGIAGDTEFISSFFGSLNPSDFIPTSSASRLLAGRQSEYTLLEDALAEAYGRAALLFNSGYHANTGIIRALASKSTLFIADKLVHASIIDGLNLATSAGATFIRFRHNDFDHLARLMDKHARTFDRVVIIVESVYSMDGDATDLDAVLSVRDMHPDAMVYIDEAHAVGVLGSQGLGMARGHARYNDCDIIVGTFGKALASIGAYAVISPGLREYLVNSARSLIFSTALPPVTMRWSLATLRYAMEADNRRAHLRLLGEKLAEKLGKPLAADVPGHIQPLIVGDPVRAVELSRKLMDDGFRVLPIRTPTVPPGTDRLRFSLSAALPLSALDNLGIP